MWSNPRWPIFRRAKRRCLAERADRRREGVVDVLVLEDDRPMPCSNPARNMSSKLLTRLRMAIIRGKPHRHQVPPETRAVIRAERGRSLNMLRTLAVSARLRT